MLDIFQSVSINVSNAPILKQQYYSAESATLLKALVIVINSFI